jgi:RNA polymerase sigma-70 factor (ECF subfamily)
VRFVLLVPERGLLLADSELRAEEASVVEDLKSRDASAWTTLYDYHHAALFRYVRVRTGDALVAEDLTAQVFEQAIKGIAGYRYQGKPVIAWLYRIARNLVSDHLKQNRRNETQPLSATREPAMSGALIASTGRQASLRSGDPAGDVHLLDLRNALLRLKDAHREVLALHYYVGLPLPEVAAVLGKKERAVYSLHARAIEALRRRVDEISR